MPFSLVPRAFRWVLDLFMGEEVARLTVRFERKPFRDLEMGDAEEPIVRFPLPHIEAIN